MISEQYNENVVSNFKIFDLLEIEKEKCIFKSQSE